MFKKLYRRASTHKRKVIAGYLIVLAAYLFLVALYVIFFILYKKQTHAFFDNHFEPGFGAALSSSILEDLTIFIILGFLASIVSTLVGLNNPEDNSFETRLKTLANSQKIIIDDQLYNFLKKNISNFLAFNKKISIVLEIRNYNEAQKAFYIYAQINTVITNMCKDNDYEATEAKAFINPDIQVNGEWGLVAYLGTYDPKTNATVNEIINAQKLAGPFEEKVEILIPKNEELGWLFEFLIWNKTDPDQGQENVWYYNFRSEIHPNC